MSNDQKNMNSNNNTQKETIERTDGCVYMTVEPVASQWSIGLDVSHEKKMPMLCDAKKAFQEGHQNE